MGSESGKRGGEVRLAATWTGYRIAITDQLLEFSSTIFTNVFKNRHFTDSEPLGSVLTILAQEGMGVSQVGDLRYADRDGFTARMKALLNFPSTAGAMASTSIAWAVRNWRASSMV